MQSPLNGEPGVPAIPGERLSVSVPGLEFVGELGSGRHSVVHRARRGDGAEFAVKVLRTLAPSNQVLVGLRREAALLASVEHPGLPRVHESGESAGLPYLVMDLVEGRPLAQLLAAGPLPAGVAAHLLAQVADALDVAHRHGIVHRDVKPQNILVSATDTVTVIDFGLAGRLEDDGEQATVGSLAYSSPEQCRVLRRPVDHRSDLYSLGVVLFECITGHLPFEAGRVSQLLRMHAVQPPPDPRTVLPDLPEGLAELVTCLLHKDPDDRPASAADVADALRRLADDPDGTVDVALLASGTEPWADVPFCGRDEELRAVLARWRQAEQSQGGACLVTGAAGLGKSRLAGEVARTAGAAGALVLQGRCSPDDLVPMGALRAAVAGWLHHLERAGDGDRERAVRAVRAAAGDAAPLLSGLSPALARITGAATLPDADRHGQLAEAVAAFVADLALELGPVLVQIEDVQWADALTVRVLRLLARRLPELPLLLLATARDDQASASGVEAFAAAVGDAGSELALPPLDGPGVAALVAARMPGLALDGSLVQLLLRRSHGNPFVVLEYLEAMVDAGLLRPSWGRWLVEESGLDALALPQDAIDLVVARLASLDPDERKVLATAAVIGTEFDPLLLGRVAVGAAGAPCDVAGALGQAVSARLVDRRRHGRYGFVHDRVREALLDSLAEADRRRTHHDIAEALDAADGSGPAVASHERIYQIAHHYMHGEPDDAPDRVARACLAAGRLALADHAPVEAVRFLTAAHAAGAADDPEFLLTYGTALQRAGHFEPAREALLAALAEERDPFGQALIHLQLAVVHRSSWALPLAHRAVHDGLAVLGVRMPRGRWSGLAWSAGLGLLGWLVARSGIGFGTARGRRRKRHELVLELHASGGYTSVLAADPLGTTCHVLARSLSLSRIGPSAAYAKALAGAGVVQTMAGLRRAGRRAFARARAAAVASQDPSAVAYVAGYEGAAAYMSGADDGQLWAQRLLEHGRWMDKGLFADGCASLAWDAAVAGRTKQAWEWYERGHEHASASGGADEVNALETIRAVCLSASGRFAEAAAELVRVRERLGAAPSGQLGQNYAFATALALLEQSDVGPAFAAVIAGAADGLPRRGRSMRQYRLSNAVDALGRLEHYRQTGPGVSAAETARRRRAARSAVRRLRAGAESDLMRAFALVARADLATLEGHPDRALALLSRLRPPRPEAPRVSFEAARVEARAWEALGFPEEARREAQAAHSVAAEHGWWHRAGALSKEFQLTAGTQEPAVETALHPGTRLATSFERMRLEALQKVSAVATAVLDLEDLTRAVLDETIGILNAERAYLYLTTDAGTDAGTDGHGDPSPALTPYLGRTASGEDIRELTGHSASLVERVLHMRAPLVVTGTDDGVALGSESVVLNRLRSIMVAPVRLDGRLIGVVYLDSQVANGIFTPEDAGILEALTTYVATAVETSRAAQLEVSVQSARQQRDLAEALRLATIRMAGANRPDEVLAELVTAAAALYPDAVVTIEDGAGPPPGEGHAGGVIRVPVLSDAPQAPVLTLRNATANRWNSTDAEVLHTLVAQAATAHQRASLFAQVQRMASTDELTGLANRRHFFDRAERVAQRARAAGHPVTVLMIDIDHFKRINDTLGHPVGDDVIRGVADVLARTLRPEDLIGRYGGEEFVAFVQRPDPDGVMAERLRSAVQGQPVETRQGQVSVTVSIGSAQLAPAADSVSSALARADRMLYDAKHAGRNQVRVEAMVRPARP